MKMAKRPVPLYDFKAFGAAIKAARNEYGESRKKVSDGKLLASSFGCGLETADIEFAWTREAAGDRGTHLGRHLIQSFAVGEQSMRSI